MSALETFNNLPLAERIEACTRIIDVTSGIVIATLKEHSKTYVEVDLGVLRAFVQSYPRGEMSATDREALREALTEHEDLGHEAGHEEKDEVLDMYRKSVQRLLGEEG